MGNYMPSSGTISLQQLRNTWAFDGAATQAYNLRAYLSMACVNIGSAGLEYVAPSSSLNLRFFYGMADFGWYSNQFAGGGK
jgi:hypothetical protein